MNSSIPSHVLNPTIQKDGLQDFSLLSLRATFLTCFFCGPLVGYVFMRKNQRFFQRPKLELAVAILLTFISMGAVYEIESSKHIRMFMQFSAVLLWLIHYVLNRKEYRLYELRGSQYANPWVDVGKSWLLGFPLTALVYFPVIWFKVVSK